MWASFLFAGLIPFLALCILALCDMCKGVNDI